MGGGLMQLVAYGAQDIYLTGNPQITFFKVVYRRHTNFSMETITQTISGTPSSGGTSTVTISRNGDLVSSVYVTTTKDAVTAGSTSVVDQVEVEIGGQRIDRQYSQWMNIWTELSTPESKAIALKSMQGDIGSSGSTGPTALVQVPLQFWFCRNPGLALPLIALQYHEVKLKITWGSDGDSECAVDCDYIYLDTDERRRFAQVSHEYLIEQVQREQFTSESGLSAKLNFNHPVKELIWTSGSTAYTDALLKLNGHDRFAKQKPEYFQLRQPYQYHTAVPKQNLPSASISNLGSTEDVVSGTKGSVGHASLTGLNTDVLTTVLFNLLTVDSGAGTTSIAYSTATAGGTVIALLGTSAALLGMVSTPRPGDLHLVSVNSLEATDGINAGTQIARVRAVHMSNNYTGAGVLLKATLEANGAIQDSTAAGVSNLGINQLAIEYDTNIGGLASVASERLTIQKLGGTDARTSQLTKKINVYSFALKPEEHQPSGTCNFSRIDSAQLNFTGTPDGSATVNVYAVNYNVLRIMSGMGGLAYSN